MTGLELRLRRTAARVTVTDLAAAFIPPVSPSRVSQIESRDRVTDDAQKKYLDALATLTTVPTTASIEVPA